MTAQSAAQSGAQSPHKAAHDCAHSVCPPCKGDTLCAVGSGTLCKTSDAGDSPTADPKLSTGRIVSKLSVTAILEPDPEALAWAHAMRLHCPLLVGAKFTRAESEAGRLGHEDWHVIADRRMAQWWAVRGHKW